MSFQHWIIAFTFALAIYLWLSRRVPIVLTSLLAPLFLVLCGAFSFRSYVLSFIDPVIVLLAASLVIARALSCSGLDVRFVNYLLRSSAATATPFRLVTTVGVASCVMSLFMSNTAVTSLLLPVIVTLVATLKLTPEQRNLEIALFLMISWGSSVAVGVLVGTPPNLIAHSYLANTLGISVGFLEWSLFAMPINIICLAAACLLMWVIYLRSVTFSPSQILGAHDGSSRASRFSEKERLSLRLLGIIVLLWIVPDLTAMVLGGGSEAARLLSEWLSPTKVGVAGALLFLALPLPQSRKPVLAPRELFSIDWSSIFLFAGGIALGRATFESGLAAIVGQLMVTELGVSTNGELILLFTATAVILSELTSNTAAATMLIPIAASSAQALALHPSAAVISVALGASFGFMLPISTVPNSIIFSSGRVPIREMIRAGLWLDLVGVLVIAGALVLSTPALP